ncbi:hypothetical protein EV384_5398 [Micromonospora kangleipakensis]|uniref:Uncharacterized protein n=2 Tax=Micromonospora kangleipakensis TaxID=1077942 RepID=A0A4Q8BFH9_9ACTN|nr:hypothetical protein EV384_5398 [Micromonospora kangleipakensis]
MPAGPRHQTPNEATEAAFAAIAGEPLRESANAALIKIFLAERNVAQARHQLERYAALMWSEFRIRPSAGRTNRSRQRPVPLPAGDDEIDGRLTRR